MPYREFAKNSSQTVRVAPKRYENYDLIDIRVFARNREGVIVPTPKGVSLNVDQVPDLLECLEWALQQTCYEEFDAAEDPLLSPYELDVLAVEAHRTLAGHGLPIHWDIAETMVLDNPGMARFNKWQLHYVLTTRRDLFLMEESGCFRALPR